MARALYDLDHLSAAVRLLHPVGTNFPPQFEEYERYVNTHSTLEEIDYGHLISLIHYAVCSEPGPAQPEWTNAMRDLDLLTNGLGLQSAFLNLEHHFETSSAGDAVCVCSQDSTIFTLFCVFCGLGLHTLEYNCGSHDLAQHTACRIRNLIQKIGDSIMICGDNPPVQHLARKLYIAITWYGRFGNDSQPMESNWYQLEGLRYVTAAACFYLEECGLEARWPKLLPFASWPYTDKFGQAFLPSLA